MFSTCLFCHADLGRNEAIESFPVGRRLAFDAARGRLWVVCLRCGRWNLSPLEARFEAVEACERAYRGTRLRVSTEHVGLARLREGMDLVRIGRPLRPEFAAWRYGDRFASRRRAWLLRGAALQGAKVAGAVAALGASSAFGPFAAILFPSARGRLERWWQRQIVARVGDAKGRPLLLRRAHLSQLDIAAGAERGEWTLAVRHAVGDVRRWSSDDPDDDAVATTVLGGDAARHALSRLLPLVNASGGEHDSVALAVERIGHARSAEAYLQHALGVVTERRRHKLEPSLPLAEVAPSVRLALEMAAHEEDERRALEGELAALERAWRDAEEVARIADDLLVPERVRKALARLRGEHRSAT